ncbi:MAG: type IV pilus assembly protein PilM [bacterium]|nr:type IV pilus assembly protein PilM [bacterium]
MFGLQSLFGLKSYLGVDIGTTSIKVAEVVRSSNGAKLKNYGILETYTYLDRSNEALQTSSLKLIDTETATYLKLLMSRAGIKTDRVVASLPAFSAFTTLVELPAMPPEDLARTMQFQAKQYVPLPIAAVTLDWLKVGERIDENGAKKDQIFLIAILNEQINKYRKIFEAADLKLVAMEVEGISQARVFTAGVKEPVMIIDIGARSTGFSIAQNGFLKFTGQTDFAGGSLTQILASGLGVSTRKAEELKKQHGLTGGGATGELSTLIRPILDVIINEAKRIKNNYEDTYKEKVGLIVLAGGGSRLPGVANYISQQLDIVAEKGNPFKKVEYPPELTPLIEDLRTVLSTSIGLGLKSDL